tara:strand:- start:133 stop:960 length:828 start_codon:yes stop_codon:yes gene_type:complete
MVDIGSIKITDLNSEKLMPINDNHLQQLKDRWYKDEQKPISHNEFIEKASAWFLGTELNKLQGTEKFPCVDIIMGCTHFIESLASKRKWQIQILDREYAYYTVMGKQHTSVGDLKPGIPLVVSLPNYFHGNRPDWKAVLNECEEKEIDIHVDCAWLTAAKDFNFNFDHPNIKSFAMSMSKYNFTWNRIGLRWSRQRTMDSCTLISAQKKYNELTTSCGAYMMDNLPRDYGWQKYGKAVDMICHHLDLEPTMFFYVVKDKAGKLYSIGEILGKIKL